MKENFIKNDFGIRIKQSCVSCRYFDGGLKRLDGEERKKNGQSICRFDDSKCRRDEICQAYEMHERYRKIGSTEKGLIHTREYTLFVQAHLDEANIYIDKYRNENKNDKQKLDLCPTIIEFINDKWRECYGKKSKFING